MNEQPMPRAIVEQSETPRLEILLDKIKDPEFKGLFLDSKDALVLQAVLSGIKPAGAVDERTAKLVSEQLGDGGYFSVKDDILYSRVLVIETAKKYPEYFKDLPLEADMIIDASFCPDKSALSLARMGLLLGFPKKACEDYSRLEMAAKNLTDIESIVPQGSPDWELLRRILEEQKNFINTYWERDDESPIIPPQFYGQADYLFHKYLPKETADASLKKVQGRRIKAGGVAWLEWEESTEGSGLKQKYRDFYNSKAHHDSMGKELDSYCTELLVKRFGTAFDPEKARAAKEMALTIRARYSNIIKIKYLHEMLTCNFNPIDGRQIGSMDDLNDYLKLLDEEYAIKEEKVRKAL